ncbi:cell volume regulation protein A [Chryseomicrobium aureum]|uniref:potassium/proton antiporter n=1 Tax=Chryseomicrobium aureum TaxID=1441723 RepID=UPI001959C604|nr:potassium/proton antiporter [Chryseomicrobium aureum]MBM7707473.1 cell volume regulation protein A [Chryseomicrobium aureum]
MTFTVDSAIFVLSILLIVGVATTKFSSRLGLPSLVLFIGVGMIASQYIYFDNAKITQLVGILALIVILFEGGMQTKWRTMRTVLPAATSLATIGVLLTTVGIGVVAKFVLGLSWLEGMLFGAIVGSTDAAAVFAVLGNKNIKPNITSTLEVESGTNDPMAVFLTITFISLIQAEAGPLLSLIGSFFWQMGIGLLVGLLIGRLSVWAINKINLDSSGLYPVLAMGFAIFTYAFTTAIGASGLLAVYVMAVVLGNMDLTYRHSIFRFNEGFAWMMQICMFILLGLLVFPNQLRDVIWQGLLLALILMFVARPLGVYISLLFSQFNAKEKLFISWAGLRGAVPIVLATYPLLAGLENADLLFNVVFFVVLLSALFQGATLTPFAEKLGLVGPKTIQVPHSLELVSIGKTNTEIIEIVIEENATIVGQELKNVELPTDTLITAVIRGNRVITPRGDTFIEAGDVLYVLVPKTNRSAIKKLFRQSENEQ